MSELKRLMPEFALTASEYDESGDIFKVMIRASYYLEEIMVVLITKIDISKKTKTVCCCISSEVSQCKKQLFKTLIRDGLTLILEKKK